MSTPDAKLRRMGVADFHCPDVMLVCGASDPAAIVVTGQRRAHFAPDAACTCVGGVQAQRIVVQTGGRACVHQRRAWRWTTSKNAGQGETEPPCPNGRLTLEQIDLARSC